MTLFHKHDWQQTGEKYQTITRPYGNQGFVKTIYFHIEQCASCGKQRRAIYNEWVHKPETDPDPNNKWAPNHAVIMNYALIGSAYEYL